jgi:hypothetical protein
MFQSNLTAEAKRNLKIQKFKEEKATKERMAVSERFDVMIALVIVLFVCFPIT